MSLYFGAVKRSPSYPRDSLQRKMEIEGFKMIAGWAVEMFLFLILLFNAQTKFPLGD